MKRADELTHEQLAEMVTAIQSILWRKGDRWDADKTWGAEAIERVAEVLEDAGLRPGECSGHAVDTKGAALAAPARGPERHRYRVAVTGRHFGLSVTYRDARGPAEALKDRLGAAERHALSGRGEAKVVRIKWNRTTNLWEDEGQPLFFTWLLEGTGAVLKPTRDKRVIKSLSRYP